MEIVKKYACIFSTNSFNISAHFVNVERSFFPFKQDVLDLIESITSSIKAFILKVNSNLLDNLSCGFQGRTKVLQGRTKLQIILL